MSGLMGQLLGNILGGQQEGQPTAIAGVLQQVLTANGGGVASLVSRFESAGLGSHAQSWVSTGENLPVSADQIGEAFSTSEIEDGQHKRARHRISYVRCWQRYSRTPCTM